MQVTLDGYILGPDGEADWVDSWADSFDLLRPLSARRLRQFGRAATSGLTGPLKTAVSGA